MEEEQQKKNNQSLHLPGLTTSVATIPDLQVILALEEPEAHVHPHVQRSIFKYFLSNESSVKTLLVTTHSPHIASVAGVDRIIVLRNEVPSLGTTGRKVDPDLFDNDERNDINRYLDVTRGELLFARGIIFVEGTSEVYIVHAFARSMGFDLDHLGISIVSVQGTDFKPYIKLASPRGLDIKFAMLTDGDQNISEIDDDESFEGFKLSPGQKRGLRIVSSILDPDFRTAEEHNVTSNLNQFGIFVGENTLEIDLLQFYEEEMGVVYDQLVQGQKARAGFKQSMQSVKLANDSTDFLNRINQKGKGRFAQKLSSFVHADRCPSYVRECLTYIVSKVTPPSTENLSNEGSYSHEIPI